MHVTLLTYGSRGDVEPFVALGRGLLQAGFDVRLAVPQPFAPLATAHGLDVVGLPGEPLQLVEGLVDTAGRSWPRQAIATSRFVLPVAVRVFEQVQTACQGTDAIVHSFLFTLAGHDIAKRLKVPDVSIQFFPVFTTTAAFPGVVFPDLPLGPLYRRLTHQIVTHTYWLGSRVLYRQARRTAPHMPPLTGWPFDPRHGPPPPILYAFSRHVIPPPADWPDHVRITGPLFLDESPDWRPPQPLTDFLEAGPAPVSVGFGSTASRDADRIAEITLEALARCGRRGVVVGPGLAAREVPETVLALDYAPYGWLFPRSSMVVHHGGAGTTAQGLRAGVPNVVVPFTSDQPFWGRRVFDLGAGPRPIPAARLSAARLARAIAEAGDDGGMRRRAQALGERMRQEQGLAAAVEAIEKLISKRI